MIKRVFALTALAAALVGPAFAGDPIPGSGFSSPGAGPATGADAYGNTWSWNFFPTTFGNWGMPGLGAGQLGFQVPPGTAPVTNLEIVFLYAGDMGYFIDQTPGTFGGFTTETRFQNSTDGVLWNTVFTGPSQVSFFAPTGTQLDAGDSFFVNVVFNNNLSTAGALSEKDSGFSAVWTTAIPEPETYALMLAGLAAVGFVARRRKA